MRILAVSVSLILIIIPGAGAESTNAGKFDWRRDTFAFANDTVLDYGVDETGHLTMHRKEKKADFAHRCFPMCRGVMQFYQFARFAPELAKVSTDEYRKRMLRVFRIPVWWSPRNNEERVVIPGFPDLRSFSARYEHLIKRNIGEWLPTYLRFGNWRIMNPTPRAGQERLAGWLTGEVNKGNLRAVYLYRIPWMNHVVVVHGYDRLPNGDTRFYVYDPNYGDENSTLLYRSEERSFDFPARWYWTGGQVNVMRVYISPIH
jgi:hypothetical protein